MALEPRSLTRRSPEHRGNDEIVGRIAGWRADVGRRPKGVPQCWAIFGRRRRGGLTGERGPQRAAERSVEARGPEPERGLLTAKAVAGWAGQRRTLAQCSTEP